LAGEVVGRDVAGEPSDMFGASYIAGIFRSAFAAARPRRLANFGSADSAGSVAECGEAFGCSPP
jgi:hypothetical protein